ncbi:MAG: cadmium-translocating P-type ATPase [Chloroflexi bacterium]|nr:cadmium-translocating P-type ATPase [Chloroflexota bacterium]
MAELTTTALHFFRRRLRAAVNATQGLALEWILTGITLVALVTGWLLEHNGITGWPVIVAYIVAYVAGGSLALINGLQLLWTEHQLDVDLLMVAAALGAAYIGHPAEGAVLLFLFSLSNALQTYALDRNRKAIEALLDLRPPVATVRRGDAWVTVPVEEVQVGDIILVRPGERFPLDGVVVQGVSEVDQSPITGESAPVLKEEGAQVFAGTVNGTGALEVRVTRRVEDTTLAKIVRLVEEAQATKATTQRRLEAFEQKYATFVLLGAVVLIVVLPTFFGYSFEEGFYKAMLWLVVASPCALVISTPASILAALAHAARRGVLIKGGVYLELLADLKVVALDKTGTLTAGKPRLTHFEPLVEDEDPQCLLRQIAALEVHSEHPVAKAIVKAAEEQGLSWEEAEGVRAVPGRGVEGEVEGRRLWVGNLRLFAERGLTPPPALQDRLAELEAQGHTAVLAYAPDEGRWLALIAVADSLRPGAREAVAELKALGTRVVMLTGDNERVAASIAAQVGVDDFVANLLPQDKVTAVEQLVQKYGPTAMVGDGVNDAPALAKATVGVAMGGAGTDVALETADVVLMGDDLKMLPYTIRLARKARRIITQNLIFALGMIVVLVVSAFVADLPLTLGVLGHEGSTVIVVLNGLRLLRGAS